MNDSTILLIIQMVFVYGAFVWTIPWYIVWMPMLTLFTLGIILLLLAIIVTAKKVKQVKKEE